MLENATIFSLFNSGKTLVYFFVLQEINIHKWLHGEVVILKSPSQRETAQNCSAVAKVTKKLHVAKSNGFSVFILFLSCIQHSWTHPPENILFFWLLCHPSILTCLLPTWPTLRSLPGWHLLFISTLNLEMPPGLGPLPSFSFSLLSPQVTIQHWASNCILVIPKFMSHPQTSTLDSRQPYQIIYWTCAFKAPSRALTCQIRTLDAPHPNNGSPSSVFLPFFSIPLHNTTIHPVMPASYLDIILNSPTSITLMNPVGLPPK